MAYKLELKMPNGEIKEELFDRQIQLTIKYGLAERSIRTSIKEGKFIKGREYEFRISEVFKGKDDCEVKIVEKVDGEIFKEREGIDLLDDTPDFKESKLGKLECSIDFSDLVKTIEDITTKYTKKEEKLKEYEGKEVYTALLLGDIHSDKHDIPSVSIINKILENNSFDMICTQGDELDIMALSKFAHKVKTKPDIKKELETFVDIMKGFKDRNPKARTVRLGSNHVEQRINEYIAKVPEMEGLLLEFMDKLNSLTDENYDYGIPYFPFSEVGNNVIRCVHGRYLSTQTQANKSKVDTVIAHIHKPSMNPSPVSIAYSIPALCDLSPKYMQGLESDWRNGFGVLKYYPEVNKYRVDLYIIENNSVVFNDKVYRS